MDKFLCIAIFVSVLGGLPSHLSLKYHFVEVKMNWTEAQRHCRQNFTDLATIEEEKDNTEVLAVMKNNSWIGLHAVIWKWSLGHEALGVYRPWKSGQPDNSHQNDQHNNNNQNEECVGLIGEEWHDVNCDKHHPFICFDEKNKTNQYVVVSLSRSWRAAQEYCRANHTDLVSVRNASELTFIKRQVEQSKLSDSSALWIGLSRAAMDWKWSDKRESAFTRWQNNKPETNKNVKKQQDICVEIHSRERGPHYGEWNDDECNTSKPFVCYHNQLFLVREAMTWFDALAHCKNHNTSLVSVHNERVQHWVSQLAQQASSPHVWIGLRYTCTLDYWFWVNGNSTCYQNWAPGNGTGWEECGLTGAVQRDGENQWVSMDHKEKLNFICSGSDDY